MANLAKRFAGATQATGTLDCVSQLREDCRLARAVETNLELVRMLRVNVLLVGPDSVIRNILDQLRSDLRGPIATWCAGERLVPPVSPVGTMILYGVGALTHDDQRRLLTWSDQVAGRTQIVSITQTPLLPRLQAGAFIDTLHYRLNTVCIDVSD